MRVSIGKTTGYSALEKQKLDRGVVKLAAVIRAAKENFTSAASSTTSRRPRVGPTRMRWVS